MKTYLALWLCFRLDQPLQRGEKIDNRFVVRIKTPLEFFKFARELRIGRNHFA